MNSRFSDPVRDDDAFLATVREVAAPFGWRVRSFTRDEEVVALATLDNDLLFEQVLWINVAKEKYVRCLLVTRGSVPEARKDAILELCARINDGLIFGCAEYSFEEGIFVFRDAITLECGKLSELLSLVTARLLDLGSRYSAAIQTTLAGMSPEEALRGID